MKTRPFAWLCVFAPVAVICGCGWLASVAAAEFGPIQLVSKSSKEQAEFAKEPALSGDGQFVAFVGQLGGHPGLFRKDLTTGAITLIVERHHAEEKLEAPSISAEGRFVAFTTGQALLPELDSEPESSDVYVADLGTSPPTFELASSSEGHSMSGGSKAASDVSMSADGSEVAFVNQGQVYLHRVGVKNPVLISVKKGVAPSESPQPVPGPGGGAYQPAGAAISADGNAVAWIGENLAGQVSLLPEEEIAIRGFEGGIYPYREPLWRLVPTTSEPNPPTRRIVGGGDPLAPGCPTGGSLAEPACQGPFPTLDKSHEEFIANNIGEGWGLTLPKLSADGQTVVACGAPEEFGDLFVVDMASGLRRIEAVRQLTKWTNPSPAARTIAQINAFQPYVGSIGECAISPEGNYVAFTTLREFFSGGSTLVTPTPSVPAVYPELYQINIENRTIERATPGPGTEVSLASGEGGEAQGGAELPSYSADGRLLAFADKSYNLVAGDANEKSDVFLVESTPPAPIEQTAISPRPSAISVIPARRLTAHAVSRPNGAIRIIATVPGAGTLRVSAKSPLGPRLRSRVVDSAHRSSAGGGEVRVELKLPRRWRQLARRKGGLYTWLELQFKGSEGSPLQQQFAARFRAHHPKRSKKGKAK
jgi:Tol biopolymer transport system component